LADLKSRGLLEQTWDLGGDLGHSVHQRRRRGSSQLTWPDTNRNGFSYGCGGGIQGGKIIAADESGCMRRRQGARPHLHAIILSLLWLDHRT